MTLDEVQLNDCPVVVQDQPVPLAVPGVSPFGRVPDSVRVPEVGALEFSTQGVRVMLKDLPTVSSVFDHWAVIPRSAVAPATGVRLLINCVPLTPEKAISHSYRTPSCLPWKRMP